MAKTVNNLEMAFGYLSSLQSAEHGYFGGYLILSRWGRPLEFHCTSPVQPSRAQEILYGPTLQPYLLGEQISGSLLQAARLTPLLILTDQPAMLAARQLTHVPVVLLVEPPPALQDGFRSDLVELPKPTGDASSASAGSACVRQGWISAGAHQFQLPTGFESETDAVRELLAELSRHVDVAEPFARIQEAVREAQRIGARPAESHGEAA